MPKGYEVGRGATDQKGNNCASNLPIDQVATRAPISTCAQWGIKKRTPINLTIAVLYLKLR